MTKEVTVEAEIVNYRPEKFTRNYFVDIVLDYSDALKLMEMGFNVKCITPGTPLDWTPNREWSSEYILYVSASIRPMQGHEAAIRHDFMRAIQSKDKRPIRLSLDNRKTYFK